MALFLVDSIGHSHIALLVLFSLFVSSVFAALTKDDPREQLRFGALLFAGFLVSALALGWLMYPFPI
jgi:heme A synthase